MATYFITGRKTTSSFHIKVKGEQRICCINILCLKTKTMIVWYILVVILTIIITI